MPWFTPNWLEEFVRKRSAEDKIHSDFWDDVAVGIEMFFPN